MPLESATLIHQLNEANPLGSDPIASGDDHLRLIKATLKATFPNITGPVTVTHTQLNNPFPVGGIIMWSGSIASVPSGWALCNGQNGTPDLRNRFIVGAGDQYAVAATGGNVSTTLVEANLPAHTHSITASGTTASAGDHSHSINDPGHTHSIGFSSPAGWQGPWQVLNGNDSFKETTRSFTGISINNAGAHTHTVTVSGTSGSTGSGTSFENRPPYYALAYIMKV